MGQKNMNRNTITFKKETKMTENDRDTNGEIGMCNRRQPREVEGRNYLLDTEVHKYRKRCLNE